MTRDSYTAYKQILNVQSITTCIPVLTPQGPIQHLKALMGKLSQIECQSLTRRVLYHQQNWGVLTQDNWVLQTVRAVVSNRSYPHSTSVTYTTSNRSVTRKTCSSDTGGSGIAIQGSNSGEYTISNEFYLPDFPG